MGTSGKTITHGTKLIKLAPSPTSTDIFMRNPETKETLRFSSFCKGSLKPDPVVLKSPTQPRSTEGSVQATSPGEASPQKRKRFADLLRAPAVEEKLQKGNRVKTVNYAPEQGYTLYGFYSKIHPEKHFRAGPYTNQVPIANDSEGTVVAIQGTHACVRFDAYQNEYGDIILPLSDLKKIRRRRRLVTMERLLREIERAKRLN